VRSAPAGWPGGCRSPARRSPSIWSCSSGPGWSAGASRAGKFSTRSKPTASTRPPGPWPSSPPAGTGAWPRSNGSPKPRTQKTRRGTVMTDEPAPPAARRPAPRHRRAWKLGAPTTSAPAVTAVRATPAAALAAPLGLAAACWVVSVWQMRGMDMGVATELGSFAFFAAAWVVMMAAMMLRGAAPAVARAARAGGVRAVPLFAGSSLAAWALVGVVVYALSRPHGTAAAGAVAIAAGAYEFLPLKRHFRRRCRE